MQNKHRGQWQLLLLPILSNPAVLLTLLGTGFLLFFGGLGFLNSITTSWLHIDIVTGALAGIARPIVLAIFLYFLYLAGKLLFSAKAIQPVRAAAIIGVLVLTASFGLTGKFIPLSAGADPSTITGLPTLSMNTWAADPNFWAGFCIAIVIVFVWAHMMEKGIGRKFKKGWSSAG